MLKKIEEIDKPLFVSGIFAFVFCFFTMYYADITITARYGVVFIDSILDLKPFSFYSQALAANVTPESAVYDIGTYIIFGIWSLPIWVLNKTLGISVLSVGSLLWYKLLVVIFVFGSAYYVYKLALLFSLDENDSYHTAIIFILSVTCFFPTFVIAQYDIISVFFILYALYCFMNNDKKKFYISMAFSMIIKPFSLFMLVLLAVWDEKNIIKILFNILKGMSFYIAVKILYSLDINYRNTASAFSNGFISGVFSATFKVGKGEASFFAILLVIVYAMAYFYKKKKQALIDNYMLLFLLWFLWIAFAYMVPVNPYWIIYVSPFMAIVAMVGGKDRNNKLILEFAINISLIIIMILSYSWVYGGDHTYAYLVFKGLCTDAIQGIQGVTIAGILRRMGVEDLKHVISGICFGCIFLFGYYSYRPIRDNKINSSEEIEKINIWHIRIRILSIYAWIIATLGAICLTKMGY